MKLEYIAQSHLEDLIKAAFAKHIPLSDYRLFFFGSRVKGNSFPRSDIDLGIEGVRPLAGVLKLKLEEELENLPTLYKIDLVDFRNTASRFREEAQKFIEPIN